MPKQYENTFVREIKEKNIIDPLEILNWYRNLYHTEDNHTEHGIVAYAINDLFTEIERMRAQNCDSDLLIKDLRFRNKESQKANEGLAKSITDMEIQHDDAIRFRIDQVKRIFDEIDQALSNMKYNAVTPRKTVKVEELVEQVNWVLHEVVPGRIAEIREKYE